LLFDVAHDPWEQKNLVDDPASQTLVKEMDERLAAIMRQTGDSWDTKASRGDLENWIPGGSKQRGQGALGADWPGKFLEPTKKTKSGEKKKKRARGNDR
jgi:hypothetical protein